MTQELPTHTNFSLLILFATPDYKLKKHKEISKIGVAQIKVTF